MLSMNQEDFKVEMHGTVTPPSSIESIFDRIATAVVNKLELVLSPGEVRVLSDYLEERS